VNGNLFVDNRLADLTSLAELRKMLPDQWKKLHANPPDQRAEIRT
jgi:hypothetical protein